jgi:hypothetical protein
LLDMVEYCLYLLCLIYLFSFLLKKQFLIFLGSKKLLK